MSARLVVQKGPYPNQEYLLTEAPMNLGRSPDNEIVLHDPEVSRRHALITYSGGLYQFEDAGSTNGSFINGRRLQGTIILQHGDQIQLGESITLIFQDNEVPAAYGDEWAEEIEAEAPPAPAPTTPTSWDAPPARSMHPDSATDYYTAEANGPSRNRQIALGCGCGFLLFGLLCLVLLFFLDAYDQGRLLYCGPLYPLFDALLGPVGFNPPACP
jgi:pSer/pThr/pTyr-binding forkhead associated (FHA) protein